MTFDDMRHRFLFALTVVVLLALVGCASLLTGQKNVVPKGAGQVAVQGYGTVDKICIAVSAVAPTGKVSSASLQQALVDAAALRNALNVVMMPSATASRSRSRSAASDVINDAATVLAATLQMAAADQTFQGVIISMQAEDNRQVLTDQEKALINAQLNTSCAAAQAAVDEMS